MADRFQAGLVIANRYRLQQKIAAGGFSFVFEAIDVKTDTRVVVKIPRWGEHRVLPEGVAIARLLSHPGLAQVKEVVRDERELYVVEEYVEGASLSYWWNERTVAEILRVFLSLAQALDYLHRAGLVHNDVKPANVIVRPGLSAVIVDYGLLQRIEAKTQLDYVVGTPSYISPEKLRGDPSGTAGDMFSFGVMLYEALMKERYFGGGGVLSGLLQAVEGISPSQQKRLERSVSKVLAKLVLQLLSPSPSRRPSAGEVVGVMGDILKSESPPFAPNADFDIDEAKANIYAREHVPEINTAILRRLERIEKAILYSADLTDTLVAAVDSLREEVSPDVLERLVGKTFIASMPSLDEPSLSQDRSGRVPLNAERVRDDKRSPIGRSLIRRYSGVWGYKVFWLAIFTLAPLVFRLKSKTLGLEVSVATLVYAVYHGSALLMWARVHELKSNPSLFGLENEEDLEWAALDKRDQYVRRLEVLVALLLFFTVAAKLTIAPWGLQIPLPEIIYQVCGVGIE